MSDSLPISIKHESNKTLVTGIADLLQIYISYDQRLDKTVTFHIQVINATSIMITNCLLSVALSDNLEMLSSDSVSHYATVSSEQVIDKTITARLKRFDPCTCTVIATLQDWMVNQGKSEYPSEQLESGGDECLSIKSLPFTVSLVDLVLPDALIRERPSFSFSVMNEFNLPKEYQFIQSANESEYLTALVEAEDNSHTSSDPMFKKSVTATTSFGDRVKL